MTAEALRREAEQKAAAGDHRGAAEIYERFAAFVEAAESRSSGGEPELALENLTRVKVDDARYREACVMAVRLARDQNRPSLALENLIARFLKTAPEDDAEVETLEYLAELYERHGFTENAAEAVRKLAARRPGYAETAHGLSVPVAPPPAELVDLPPLPTSRAGPPEVNKTPQPLLAESEGPPLHPGTVIGGRYRLEERVGQGGTSVVFRATDLNVGDPVAVKVLTKAVFDAEDDVRLRRELMLSRQLVHPNVVRVFEMGLAHGFRYLAMELLEGTRLSERMRTGEIPIAEGLGYVAQACAGLHAAHRLGIVHRDVKPGNLFIHRGGILKVMDFGLAKVRDSPGLTTTGVIAGTPAYMAPEQGLDFRAVTSAADMYSVGVVAYEMFTGTLPFNETNPLAMLTMHRDVAPPRPRDRNPAVPAEVERMILDCLEKDPVRRPASCREMSLRIEAFLAGRPASTRPTP